MPQSAVAVGLAHSFYPQNNLTSILFFYNTVVLGMSRRTLAYRLVKYGVHGDVLRALKRSAL
jgi:hypothetical protein